MLLKNGVVPIGVQPPIWYALGVFEELYANHGATLIVTSLVEGFHPKVGLNVPLSSIHSRGLAADIRLRDLSSTTLQSIVHDATNRLYKLGFDVVIEVDHIHVEWDPKPTRSEWLTYTA